MKQLMYKKQWTMNAHGEQWWSRLVFPQLLGTLFAYTGLLVC